MNIHLLDMGRTKYGDCLVITHQNRRILIDGAHPGDRASIRAQLKQVLKQEAPFIFDLLVVTHCHSDHIGCLPDLLGTGDVQVKAALVADEKLGFGRPLTAEALPDAAASPLSQTLAVALQEEDQSTLPADELALFLQDAGTLEDKYIAMLGDLAKQGIPVIRYGSDNPAAVQELERDFADFGLRIIGPTPAHLRICYQEISATTDALTDAFQGGADSTADASELYRQLIQQYTSDAVDQSGVGAAKNNQSLVLKVEADGWCALLAGDMQFAKPEVSGLADEMTALRHKVQLAGPYDFIKLTHHTSYNGLDASVLAEWAPTTLYAHTGGLQDPGHPDKHALSLLKSNQATLQLARTDRNGLITVAKVDGKLAMTINRGSINDFIPNTSGDAAESEIKAVTTPQEVQLIAAPTPTPEANAEITITTRIPVSATGLTVTISLNGITKGAVADQEVEQKSPPHFISNSASEAAALRIGGGRDLPPLLVITSRPLLARNIGELETQRIFAALAQTPSLQVLDLPPSLTSAVEAAALARPYLGPNLAGVLLLGGYDVVPALRLDVLDAALRRQIVAAGQGGKDADDFIVWSDDLYGDRDGDTLPELPVSRIPDGRRADVVFAALQAPAFRPPNQFGIRNFARPFADTVMPALPGAAQPMQVSETFGPANVAPDAARGAVYYMLHGSAQDGTQFWGETNGQNICEALAIENVPAQAPGTIVFTGCCWAALTAGPPAAQALPGIPLRPRGPASSIAVAYLLAGAIGYIGCTGSHYSPTEPPYNYFGKPMHDAFWANIATGKSPAEALFAAKKAYIQQMPHGRQEAFSRAIEMKIARQYTCLGLGW